ncbi:hypothetical protein CHEID_00325 [Corynebacterium heidelbergense]|nr:hypothetical protein CHEID_00325 [Corynebacterium heidelbergense]
MASCVLIGATGCSSVPGGSGNSQDSAVGEPAGAAPVVGDGGDGDGGDGDGSGGDATGAGSAEQQQPQGPVPPVPVPGAQVPVPLGPVPLGAPNVVAAQGELGSLQVKGRAPQTGYSREQFGQRWKDVDRNGCDQRNDVLGRDLVDVQRKGPCKVTSGLLHDPYSGRDIRFERGPQTSEAVQVDHVVALDDAWQKGAQQWAPEQREVFANDEENLLAVDGSLNQQKGAGDTATWLPPNESYRCAYVARQVHIKAKYQLWVTQAERDAMVQWLGRC